jgi:hypothetical protein
MKLLSLPLIIGVALGVIAAPLIRKHVPIQLPSIGGYSESYPARAIPRGVRHAPGLRGRLPPGIQRNITMTRPTRRFDKDYQNWEQGSLSTLPSLW